MCEFQQPPWETDRSPMSGSKVRQCAKRMTYTITPGATYELECWIRDAGQAQVSLLDEYGVIQKVFVFEEDGDWKRADIGFTPTNGDTCSLLFDVTGNPNNMPLFLSIHRIVVPPPLALDKQVAILRYALSQLIQAKRYKDHAGKDAFYEVFYEILSIGAWEVAHRAMELTDGDETETECSHVGGSTKLGM